MQHILKTISFFLLFTTSMHAAEVEKKDDEAFISASAGTLSATRDQPGWHTIQRVYSWSDGHVQIWMTPGEVVHSCTETSYPRRYILRSDEPGFSEKFSILLSAQVSKQRVRLRYSCGSNGVPYIRAVRMMH